MARFANSVLFTPTAGGTTDFVVSAAVQGYMTPALAGAVTGVYKYRAESADLSQWEIGEGTYTSGTTTLTRTTVLYNSAGTGTAAGQSGAGTKINFTVAPNVGIVQTVDDMIGVDQSNSFSRTQLGQIAANVAALQSVQGRLTLTSNTPILTGNVTAATTIYFTPYLGNKLVLYNGTNLVPVVFTELSVATTDTTKSPAAIGASKVNDWFVWDDAGTLRLSHGPDWTNDTTRSAGTALVLVNGVYLNNAAITNGPAASRGTYVGTTRSNASSQLDWIYGSTVSGGGAAFFGLWNMYNRRQFSTLVANSDNTWTYSVANTWRAPNGSSTMRIQAVRGLDEDPVEFEHHALCLPANAVTVFSGVGINSTTASSGTMANIYGNGAFTAGFIGKYNGTFGLGFNYASALEGQNSTTICTWLGDAGSFGVQAGLHGILWQ